MFLTLGVTLNPEWLAYCKSGDKPRDIPSAPHVAYKNKGWESLGNWLGTGRKADHLKNFKSFEEARDIVRTFDLTGQKEWRVFCKSGNKPEEIPSAPERVYKDKGWISMKDWLGKDA